MNLLFINDECYEVLLVVSFPKSDAHWSICFFSGGLIQFFSV